MAGHVHADGQVHCLGSHRATVAHFDVDAVKVDNRIKRASARACQTFTSSLTASVTTGILVSCLSRRFSPMRSSGFW